MFCENIGRLRVHKLFTILPDKTPVDQDEISTSTAEPKLLVLGKKLREHLAKKKERLHDSSKVDRLSLEQMDIENNVVVILCVSFWIDYN